MTNEEAISVLETWVERDNKMKHADRLENIEIYNMAIKALKQTMWIPVSEKMPEEHEWIGTKQFGTTISDEVYVTFETPDGDRFTKHLSFQNRTLSVMDQQTINAFHKGSIPVAWMPLPESYKESEQAELWG